MSPKKRRGKDQERTGKVPEGISQTQQQINDLIDIIVQSEEYKKNLIFRNTKFQRNGELYGDL